MSEKSIASDTATADFVNGNSKYSKTREIAFSSVGNVLVWYDFALFMPFLPIISQHFFRITDNSQRDLITFLVMSMGLFFRPIGSLIFGPMGDLIGRKLVLAINIFLMALATFVIGTVESSDHFGKAAIMVVVLRIVQGLSMGGAYTAAMVHLVENAPNNRRGLFGCLSDVGNQLGVLIAGGAVLLLHIFFSEAEIYEYAWRIPFLASILIVPFSYVAIVKFVRKRQKKTEVEKETNLKVGKCKGDSLDTSCTSIGTSPKASGIFYSLLECKRQVLCTVAITAFSAVAFYTLLTFLPYYLVNSGVLNLRDAATCNVIANVFMIGSILIGGYLSDIFGRKLFLRLGMVFVALSNYAMFLCEIKLPVIWFLIHGTYGLFIGLYYGGRSAFFAESFPKKIRCTGVSFSLSLAQAIFGGGISIVLNYCVSISRIAVVIPITVVVIFGLIAVYEMQKK